MNQEEVSHKNTANQYFYENRSMYEILEYNDIDKAGLQNKIEKVLSKLKEGEFKSAQTKPRHFKPNFCLEPHLVSQIE